MNIVEVKDLHYSYDKVSEAVAGVSFSIEKGSYTTIVGHNGSGKSTLARLLIGLLEASAGTVTIDGLLLNEENVYKIRDKAAIVFQNPDNQFIGSTVEDDIAFGLENHRVPSENMEEIIRTYAEKVGIADLLKKEPENLSGGQKQRVAIAGVLAMAPDIIIFDEATSMLDPAGKKDIKKLIKDLHIKEGITVISITHDIEEVLQADDCIVMNAGKIFMHDTPSEVFSHPAELRKISLDIPFNLKVVEAFRAKGIKLKHTDLEGIADELWQSRSRH